MPFNSEQQGSVQVVSDNTQWTGTNRFDGGSKFVIVDPTDSTKSVIFNLSGLPTATQTEFTVPDSDSSLVTLTATQTLTNKTLTSPALNGGTWVATDSTFTIADNTTPTKIARFECSGLTAGTNVFTLPNTAADTLAVLAATQTFTNKALSDSTCTVVDNTDPTKIAAFQCSGITAGQTRTFTFPDASGTLALADGATFTVNTAGAASITSGGDFDLVASGGTSDFTVTSGRNVDINAGAAGYIQLTATDGDIGLTTNGAGDDIILSAASNGSDVYINSGLRLDRGTTAVDASTTWRSILGVTSTGANRAITLEADTNVAGHIVIIKDEGGGANANNITVTPESGTIDGAASAAITANYGVLRLYGNGTNWFSF
jgi:hypothetical protein